jgi:hypothetical protein
MKYEIFWRCKQTDVVHRDVQEGEDIKEAGTKSRQGLSARHGYGWRSRFAFVDIREEL